MDSFLDKELGLSYSAMTLLPAYGRSYASEEDVLKDWNAGKDFMCYDTGAYTSIRDIEVLKDMFHEVFIVWKKNQKPYLKKVL